jgi:phage tail-like protein
MGDGPGEAKPVYGNYHWRVKLGDSSAGKFFSVTPPTIRLDNPMFTVWAENGDLVETLSGGRKVTWSPVTLSRGGDEDKTLWQWVMDCRKEGSEKHKKEVTLECVSHDGTTVLFTYTLHGAVPAQFSHSGGSAQTQEVLINTLEITYEDAEMK